VGCDLEQAAKAKMAAVATLKARVDLILGISPPVSMPFKYNQSILTDQAPFVDTP
jgi:hypothetical protein